MLSKSNKYYYAFFSTFLLFFTIPLSSYAFNITKILSQYSDFSSFNDGLTQTGVATDINSRQTITVLAVGNGAMSGLSGNNALKQVLSLHVVLDYYDVRKLQQLPNQSAILTTLFQSSGQANGKQGFLNVTHTNNGVLFGSAVPGSTLNSNLVKSITAEPYNISILQVSSTIVPPNLGGGGSGSNSSSNSTGSPTSPPSKSLPGGAPTSSPVGSPPPKSSGAGAGAPAPSNNSNGSASPPSEASSPSGASAPSGAVADSPSNVTAPAADAPTASTPTGSAASSPTGVPAADGPAADAPASKKSTGAHTRPYVYANSVIGAIAWSFALVIIG